MFFSKLRVEGIPETHQKGGSGGPSVMMMGMMIRDYGKASRDRGLGGSYNDDVK